MRKYFYLGAIILIVLTTFLTVKLFQKNKLNSYSVSQLHVEGTFLKDTDGNIVVLHGLSYGWHNWWPRFYNSGTVKTFTNDWKCSVLRVAMGVEPDSGYLKQPCWTLKTITPVIDAAIENNIYVIIDWHSHHIYTDEAKVFFAKMAKKYGRYPNIIYEIYNEPVNDKWIDDKAYAIEVIKEIRKYDSNNVILVGCPHWDQDIDSVANNPITGYNNIMYTVHFYAGTHKQWLRERSENALAKGIPIFVSECGETEASGDGPLDFGEWDQWQQWMEKNKISWCKWSVADKYESSCIFYPSADSAGKWSDTDLKESGRFIKKVLAGLSTKK